MGLDEDAIDLLEVDGLGAVADRLDEGSEAEILHAPEDPLGRSHDEAERLCGEGCVRQGDLVELGEDEAVEVALDELLEENC